VDYVHVLACKQAAVAPAAVAAAPTVAPVVRSARRSSSDAPTATAASEATAAATAAARQLNRRSSSGSSGSNSRDYQQQQQRNAPSSSGSDRSSSNGGGSNGREQSVPAVRTPPLQVHGAAAAVTAVARGVVARQGLRSAGEAKDTTTAGTTAGGAEPPYTQVSTTGHTLFDFKGYLCVFAEG
jgi:hypothetical protein